MENLYAPDIAWIAKADRPSRSRSGMDERTSDLPSGRGFDALIKAGVHLAGTARSMDIESDKQL